MKETYKTLGRRASAEIIEKKSRFIAVAAPMETEANIATVLSSIQKEHYNASHHVYAYIIGLNGEITKCTDDGEPSGTAGMPTLNAIRLFGVTNAFVVVTRYFGGTLLGTGGLTRAYGLAAREALSAAGSVTLTLCDTYSVCIAYTLLGKLQYEYAKRGYVIKGAEYSADIELTVLVETARADEFLHFTSDLSGGAARAVFISRDYTV